MVKTEKKKSLIYSITLWCILPSCVHDFLIGIPSLNHGKPILTGATVSWKVIEAKLWCMQQLKIIIAWSPYSPLRKAFWGALSAQQVTWRHEKIARSAAKKKQTWKENNKEGICSFSSLAPWVWGSNLLLFQTQTETKESHIKTNDYQAIKQAPPCHVSKCWLRESKKSQSQAGRALFPVTLMTNLKHWQKKKKSKVYHERKRGKGE